MAGSCLMGCRVIVRCSETSLADSKRSEGTVTGRPFRPNRVLDLSLLGHLQGVVHLDPQVANCAFEGNVTKEQLDGA